MADMIFNKKIQLPVLEVSDITGLQAALDGKVATTHYEEDVGKVILEDGEDLTYLGEVITTNLEVANGRLDVVGIKGLTVSTTELNYLTGATSNIQAQINALENATNYDGIADTYAQIATKFTDPDNGDLVIVITDETHGGTSSIYVYDEENDEWDYAGNFKVEVRNFSTEPINLENEVTGKLPIVNINDTLVNQVSENTTNISTLATSIDEIETDLEQKVDMVEGKGLSTEDYSTLEKAKVNALNTAGSGDEALFNDGTYKATPTEAEKDGKIYGRKNGAWVELIDAQMPSLKIMNLSGQIDGTTQSFTMTEAIPGEFMVFYNGQCLIKNINYTYDNETTLITTFSVAPAVGEFLTVVYMG